ncbi:MAG: UDP-N-acetylenolpyruvoylglucosamine reductase [Pseudomonas fluorescens]|nr:MAG: UDP-N-acetylenolpyruvoylglucosamine reductase [Pseudomonas fluorescens]
MKTLNIIPDFDLTALNTMGLRAQARFGVEMTEAEHIAELIAFAGEQGLPLHIIGGGSNLLPHEQVEAVVAVMATKGREVVGETEDSVLVKVRAGEEWSATVEWTVAQGLWGLENLVLIPGTVGAAPIQNIGAYGVELKDRFHELTAYDTVAGVVRTFDKDACVFGYRQSYFKSVPGQFVVLDVTLALPKNWQPVLGYAGLGDLDGAPAPEIMNRVADVRRSKLPDWRVFGNAGSFFHNPVVGAEVAAKIEGVPVYPQSDGRVKLSAAWLIEACGLKGYRDGPVGVYDKHALILVNHGGAAFSDIARLTAKIQSEVRARFGVELVREPLEI